jgi:hypothetical protein
MHRVPLVVAGPSVLDPYEQYEARVLDRTDDVVAACEEVAAGELARHSRIASEALASLRTASDETPSFRASVTRRKGGLHVTVSGLDALAPRRRDAAIVRMMAKLRELDPTARGIDVVHVPSS